MPSAILAVVRSPYLWLTFAMFLSASNLIVGRAVAGHVPPVALSFWRWTIAFLFLLPFAWPALRVQYRVLLREWKTLALLGFLGIAGFLTLTYFALQGTTAINASLINAMVPVLIPILAWMMFRDRVTHRQTMGILLTVAGIAVIVLRGDVGTLMNQRLAWGDPVMLFATFFWAGYSVILKRLPDGLQAAAVLSTVILFGLAMLLPLYLLEMAAGRVMVLDGASLAAIFYVGVFAAAIGFLCWHYGVDRIGPSRTGVFFNLVPVFGLGQATVLLGERLHAFHFVGVPLVLLGVWLATAPPKKRRMESP